MSRLRLSSHSAIVGNIGAIKWHANYELSQTARGFMINEERNALSRHSCVHSFLPLFPVSL